ncbi:hypothetical protein P167DRAFT_87568 [Morchella conica CCBAS932]|uniref:Uncharacterized protein n=1 Tax=Morchella conica CCBAS932 TaxID=1392247 RepID=A0A3N4L7F8_9PEZI|nr:hypothetical protein P167DRAFT_87568 [Morchella conica CCBAS932]
MDLIKVSQPRPRSRSDKFGPGNRAKTALTEAFGPADDSDDGSDDDSSHDSSHDSLSSHGTWVKAALTEVFGAVDGGSATIENYLHLCPLLIREGKLDEALKISQRVIHAYEQVLGLEHPTTIKVLSRLGSMFKRQRELDEALEMYQRALRASEKTSVVGRRSTIKILSILCSILKEQGKLNEGPTTIDTPRILDSILNEQEKLGEGALEDCVDTWENSIDSEPISQEQSQVNRKTLNKSNGPFVSGSDTDSNYICITDPSPPVGASSNTSEPSLIPRAPQNLEQIESDIASALSGMIEVFEEC